MQSLRSFLQLSAIWQYTSQLLHTRNNNNTTTTNRKLASKEPIINKRALTRRRSTRSDICSLCTQNRNNKLIHYNDFRPTDDNLRPAVRRRGITDRRRSRCSRRHRGSCSCRTAACHPAADLICRAFVCSFR